MIVVDQHFGLNHGDVSSCYDDTQASDDMAKRESFREQRKSSSWLSKLLQRIDNVAAEERERKKIDRFLAQVPNRETRQKMKYVTEAMGPHNIIPVVMKTSGLPGHHVNIKQQASK